MQSGLILTLGLLAVSAESQTVHNYTDRATFLVEVDPAGDTVDFEDVPGGTLPPFTSRSQSFAGRGSLVEDAIGLGHGFWFEGQASPS